MYSRKEGPRDIAKQALPFYAALNHVTTLGSVSYFVSFKDFSPTDLQPPLRYSTRQMRRCPRMFPAFVILRTVHLNHQQLELFGYRECSYKLPG